MRADEPLTQAKILVVDDQEANVRLLEKLLLRAGYGAVVGTTDPRQVAALWAEHDPDLIVLDLHMPHMDGFEVMQELAKRVPEGSYLPILVLTADGTPDARRRALSMGARDFLTKPFDQDEALLRIRNLLETRSLHVRLLDQNAGLEAKVRERTWELQQSLDLLQRTADNRRTLLARMVEVQRLAEAGVDEGLHPAGAGSGRISAAVLEQALDQDGAGPIEPEETS
jgi:putative two-component system response regulator